MAGHVMNAGGGAWLLSESEREDGWTTDHAFLGREVARSTSETEESRGTIYGFLPATADDPYVAEDGKPAPLFKVRFTSGELDGDVEDLELRDVVESLVLEIVPSARAAPPPKKKRRVVSRDAPAPDSDLSDDEPDAEPAREVEDDDDEDDDESAPAPAATPEPDDDDESEADEPEQGDDSDYE